MSDGYKKTAKFYDALCHFINYENDSQKIHTLIQQHNPNASTLLDVGCGTGKHLEFLKDFYTVEGLDLSSEMLEIAKYRLTNIPLHQGDMRDFYLDSTFDVVTCLFSSIILTKTVTNLFKSLERMAAHLNPQGILIVEPYISPKQFWSGRITANFVEQPDLKIAWMHTETLEENILKYNIHYLVGTPEGITYFSEPVEVGLFTHEEYREAFRQAGLTCEYDPVGLSKKRGLFIGSKY